MGESIFHWENWPNDTKKWPKVGGHMPRVTGNLSKIFFVYYWRRRSNFSAGVMQLVLKPANKDFSQVAFSYFSPSHFPILIHHFCKYFGEVGFTVTLKTLIPFWTYAPPLMVIKKVLWTKLTTTQMTILNIIAAEQKTRRLLQLMVCKILLIFESLPTR